MSQSPFLLTIIVVDSMTPAQKEGESINEKESPNAVLLQIHLHHHLY